MDLVPLDCEDAGVSILSADFFSYQYFTETENVPNKCLHTVQPVLSKHLRDNQNLLA